MNIISPITGRSDVTREWSITVDELKKLYKSNYDLNISHLIGEDISEVVQYKCNRSGYRFYEPANIVGDSDFYKKLQENDWYYMDDKWEFQEAIRHIPDKRGISVLEIGSAKGAFLNALRCAHATVELNGLELNQNAANEARLRGFNVVVQSTSEHAKANFQRYDVIVSIQVLEHVPNPVSLLHDAVQMLKLGGRLIIGVPDNSRRAYDSLLVKSDADLNMPPHHQGLWDIPSLAYLTKILPLRLEYIAVEPATRSGHSNAYRFLLKKDLMQRFGNLIGYGIYILARPFYNHALKHLNRYLPAHSILAVYIKDDV
jgi:2-polyprenyl-3-methyl-5-hydroxy-6-metoxy-1,4-benzoquinol methylase